jgi:hypothetical protein
MLYCYCCLRFLWRLQIDRWAMDILHVFATRGIEVASRAMSPPVWIGFNSAQQEITWALVISEPPEQANLKPILASTLGLFSLRSPSCLAQAHTCLSSLQSYRGTASSWGQLLRGSFLGQIRITQIIPIKIVWTQISPLRRRLGAPLGRIPRYCFATVAVKWRTSST